MASSAAKLYQLYQKSRGLDVTFSKAKLPIRVFSPHVEFSIHYKKWKRRMHLLTKDTKKRKGTQEKDDWLHNFTNPDTFLVIKCKILDKRLLKCSFCSNGVSLTLTKCSTISDMQVKVKNDLHLELTWDQLTVNQKKIYWDQLTANQEKIYKSKF